MELHLIYRNGTFYAASDEDYDKARRFRQNVPLKCNITLARNYEFHKKFFSLINTAWEYLTEHQVALYGNVNSFRKTLIIAAGYYEPTFDLQEQRFFKVPSSISFEKMSQEEFEDLYERVKDVLFRDVLKHITLDEFMSNLNSY